MYMGRNTGLPWSLSTPVPVALRMAVMKAITLYGKIDRQGTRPAGEAGTKPWSPRGCTAATWRMWLLLAHRMCAGSMSFPSLALLKADFKRTKVGHYCVRCVGLP